MFRASLTVRTADEARSAVERLHASLDKSDISGTSKSFLIDRVRETLELWREQLARPSTKSLKAERIFEGSDYRIVLKVHSSRSGIIGLVRKAFGTQ
jgi:hypothetical protein